jgi:predicted transcriptional regulator YheO
VQAALVVSDQLQTFLPLVRGIGELFGPGCEVVLHDLGALPQSIVAIENGHVTGRRVGDGPTDHMLRSLHDAPGEPASDDVRTYVSSSEGRVLKSLAVTLRDPQGTPIAIFGINLDVSDLVSAQRALQGLVEAGPTGAAPDEEVFGADIRDVVDVMIKRALAESGKTPAAMSRDEKMEVVKRLEERGAFLVKRSAEQVAEALDLSRFTIFSYLKEIRHGGGEAAAATGDASGGKA